MRTGYVKQSDFDVNSPDFNRSRDYIFSGKKITSLLDYFVAASTPESLAGKYIHEGKTPYLCSWLAYEDGVWPWVEIEDLEKYSAPNGSIGVYHITGRHFLPGDTLVFWR
ncbi:MAG TPA: hypothetical protein VFR24_00075 [Candidatus Angelobacter sp.]|nr:hypothetical protein [Candidatus Angelobacter sp.]